MDRIYIRWLVICLLGGFFALSPSSSSAQLLTKLIPYDVELKGTPGPGYIFTSPRSSVLYDDFPTNLMLMDSAANLIWFAPMGQSQSAPFYNITATDFKVLSDGRLAYWTPEHPRFWYILNQDFEVTDSVTCNNYESTDEHDLDVDADGNYILICDTTVFRDASGMLTRDSLQGSTSCAVSYQIVQEVAPGGQTLREWHSLDHIALNETDIVHWGNPSWMDHTHMNSTLLDGDGIIVSSRNLGEITRYDRQTGQVTWRLGGVGNMFTLIGDSVFFSAQHDANLTPEGNLYLFDNGTAGAKFVARYLEYELDTVNWTATLVRSHDHPAGYLSKFMGNAIHLSNDNVIVNWGGEAPEDSIREITEFAPNGDIVMEINYYDPFFSYRVHKEPLPWEIERPELNCDNGAQTLSAPAGYDHYEWNTGDTSQTITVSAPGTYQVWVNKGIGFLSSAPVTITDVNDVCLALARPEEVRGSLSVAPNPTRDRVTIEVPAALARGWELTVSDPLGRIVAQMEGRGVEDVELQTTEWIPGVYVLRLQGENQRFVGKVVRW